jgi:RNA polymerase sigma factor (sigma-70 family)
MNKFSALTEDELIQLILNDCKNKEAWEEFYNRLSGYLFAIIHHCIADYHVNKTSIDPDDIFQEVFLAFYEKVLHHNFEFMGIAQLRRYLQVIVRNKVIDSIRKLANLPEHILIDEPISESVQDEEFEIPLLREMIPSEAPSPEDELICKEDELILKKRIALLKQAISELSGKEKEVMELLLAGHKIPEITHVLGIKENHVRVIRYRALRRLQKRMQILL